MPGSKTITLFIGVGVGITSALLLRPMWLEHRALTAIGSSEASDRERGWRWLQGPTDPDRERRAESRIEAVNGRLAVAGDPALRHGADALRRIDLWHWSRQPMTLALRELDLRATSDDPETQHTVAEDLGEAPSEIPVGRVIAVADALVASDAEEVRHAGLEQTTAWLGPQRIARLDGLTIDDPALDRMRHLALLGVPLPLESVGPAPGRLDVIEARFLRRTFAEPDDAEAVLVMLDAQPVTDPHALDYVLRHSHDPRAVRALEARAESGIRGARFALHARARSVDERQARRIVRDRAQPAHARRVAAWRWRGISGAQVQPLLALPPAEEDGSVYAAALLAERCLPPDAARTRAEAWIRSFDDDEKRAGAVLAALLGEPRELLAEAYELEDMPEVRTTQRLALWAMGSPVGAEDPHEFAYRSLHRANGDFDPDTALCMLRAGETDALAVVTRPPLASRPSVQQRAWLIERFVPHWHERLGRPIGGNPRAINLHFDALNAAYHVERRHLEFDPDRHTFGPR